MAKRYCVGIDLGTSNSAIALAPAEPEARVEILPVTQLCSFQAVGELELLPSVLYLPLEHEATSSTATLPWPPAAPPLQPRRGAARRVRSPGGGGGGGDGSRFLR